MADQRVHRSSHRVLATDLDGTLIPLAGNRANEGDLQTLAEEVEGSHATLVFVTGRHFESVIQAIAQFELPQPAWIICDVGTSLFRHDPSGEFTPVQAYQTHLAQLIASFPIRRLKEVLAPIPGLRLQESEKQGAFKLSFYTDAAQLIDLVRDVQKQVHDDWYRHQLQTTANYSASSAFVRFFTGGVNLQIEHHLFPQLPCARLVEIQPIVKQVCEEFSVPYYEFDSYSKALKDHFLMLKQLGCGASIEVA